MSRYVDQSVVSTEGLGKILTGIGAIVIAGAKSIGRANAIGYISFERDSRPEVNGKPCRSYDYFIKDIRTAVASGELFDVSFQVRIASATEQTDEQIACIYFYGTGKEVVARIPEYARNCSAALSVLSVVCEDGKITA